VPASPRKLDGATTERPTSPDKPRAVRDEPAARPRRAAEEPHASHPPRRWLIAALGAGVVVAAVVTLLALRSSGARGCDDDHRAGCEAACRAGDAAACFRRARALHGGLGGISVDHEAGRVADARACELGSAEGCYEGAVSLVAVALLERRADDPRRLRRLDEAARMLQRACDRDFMKACRRLGKEYSVGFGSLAPDPAKAFQLVERACTGNDVAACKALRDMIDSGAGTTELRTEAARVLAAACARGLLPC
jgi:TPR repeat protein